jgi:hypothetical protein
VAGLPQKRRDLRQLHDVVSTAVQEERLSLLSGKSVFLPASSLIAGALLVFSLRECCKTDRIIVARIAIDGHADDWKH